MAQGDEQWAFCGAFRRSEYAVGDRSESGIASPGNQDHDRRKPICAPCWERETPVSDPNCLFCRIAAGEIPADEVYSDDSVLAFRDIAPQAPTHILIIPRKHIASVNELGPDDTELMGSMYQVAKKLAASEGISEDGYRMVINAGADGGQTVFHIHLHLFGGRRMGWPPG